MAGQSPLGRDQLLRVGWRKRSLPIRAHDDFRVTPSEHAYLAEVAWSSAAAESATEILRDSPTKRDYFFAVMLPYYFGLAAYFAVSLGGYLALSISQPRYYMVLFFLVVMPLSLSTLLFTFLRRSRVDELVHRGEALVMASFLGVMQLAETAIGNLNVAARRQLVREIHCASDLFFRAFMGGAGGKRADRKKCRQLAKSGSDALRSYATIAASFGPGGISRIRADFSRALLRVGSKHWVEVGALNPTATPEGRWRSLLSKILSKKAVIGSVVPLLVAVLKLVSPN